MLLLDLSTSMNRGAADESAPNARCGSRWAIVIEALHGLVRVLEREDSEAVAEQASGSDVRGGLMTHGVFATGTSRSATSTPELERRLNEIKWGGKPYIDARLEAALVGDDRRVATGTHETADHADPRGHRWRGRRLDGGRARPGEATAKRVSVVAIVGHGRSTTATLAADQQAADKNVADDKFGKAHVEGGCSSTVTIERRSRSTW